MKELFYAINLPFGLHARPAAHVAQIASGVKSQVTIEKDGKLANAKNVLQILSLDIKKGEEIHLMIEGEDELEAADKLEAFFRDHPVEKLDKQKVFKIAFFGTKDYDKTFLHSFLIRRETIPITHIFIISKLVSQRIRQDLQRAMMLPASSSMTTAAVG